ncbi:UNVERIFIED_CONTAM: hypothetical protein Sindi_2023200 [Sesamum indicum]
MLDVIHIDVYNPLNTLAKGGYSYFITITDDHSRYDYFYLMRYKSEAFGRFKESRLEVENQTSRKSKAHRSDRELCPRGHMRYGKPASYKYLRVLGSLAYVKRLVGDKLESRSTPCNFISYPKETARYYFYDLSDQKIFISRNAVFWEKGFPIDSRRDEEMLEESSEIPHQNNATPSIPTVPNTTAPILRRSTRISQPPDR